MSTYSQHADNARRLIQQVAATAAESPNVSTDVDLAIAQVEATLALAAAVSSLQPPRDARLRRLRPLTTRDGAS